MSTWIMLWLPTLITSVTAPVSAMFVMPSARRRSSGRNTAIPRAGALLPWNGTRRPCASRCSASSRALNVMKLASPMNSATKRVAGWR
ncbi:hypothetical protein D3C86_2052900 [compost metagenome]